MSYPSLSLKQFELFKQEARHLKKDEGITHHDALEKIAKKHGYHHWHHVTQLLKTNSNYDEMDNFKMNIYLDDRTYKKANCWKCWLISAGNNEFVKIAGARELTNGFVYEMYCRQEKNIDNTLETTDKEMFARWFKKNFKIDPFDASNFEGSGEPGHKFKQVKPSFFSGNYLNLWRETPKLYSVLSQIYS